MIGVSTRARPRRRRRWRSRRRLSPSWHSHRSRWAGTPDDHEPRTVLPGQRRPRRSGPRRDVRGIAQPCRSDDTRVPVRLGNSTPDRQWNVKTRKLTPPKHGSRGTIAMVEPVRERCSTLPRECEYVFTTLRGTHYTPSARAFHWNRVRCSIGLGNTSLYEATRHYFAWYLLNVSSSARPRCRAAATSRRRRDARARALRAPRRGDRARAYPRGVPRRGTGHGAADHQSREASGMIDCSNSEGSSGPDERHARRPTAESHWNAAAAGRDRVGAEARLARKCGVARRVVYSTRVRTTAITKTLWTECTMIPIHALWYRREG